jgi:hypothetical protein
VVNSYHVNFNKTNYYTVFLNVYAESGKDYNYFANELNGTHLEIAKKRLESFDAILTLEQPETHQQLNKWLSDNNNDDDNNNNTASTTRISSSSSSSSTGTLIL